MAFLMTVHGVNVYAVKSLAEHAERRKGIRLGYLNVDTHQRLVRLLDLQISRVFRER